MSTIARFDLNNVEQYEAPEGIPASAWQYVYGAAVTARATGSIGARTTDPDTGVEYLIAFQRAERDGVPYRTSITEVSILAPEPELDPAPFNDPADAPVVHVAVYEYPSEYEDNAPIIKVGATRQAALTALAVEVDQFLSDFPTEEDPHSDEWALVQAHTDAGPLTADMDADALAAWLGTATGNGGAYTESTEPVHQ